MMRPRLEVVLGNRWVRGCARIVLSSNSVVATLQVHESVTGTLLCGDRRGDTPVVFSCESGTVTPIDGEML